MFEIVDYLNESFYPGVSVCFILWKSMLNTDCVFG